MRLLCCCGPPPARLLDEAQAAGRDAAKQDDAKLQQSQQRERELKERLRNAEAEAARWKAEATKWMAAAESTQHEQREQATPMTREAGIDASAADAVTTPHEADAAANVASISTPPPVEPVRSGGAVGNQNKAPTPDSKVGRRVQAMEHAAPGGLEQQRCVDPLAASRGFAVPSGSGRPASSSAAAPTPPPLVGSVSRESLDRERRELIERFGGDTRSRAATVGAELTHGAAAASPGELQLRRARDHGREQAAKAASAEERAVALESKLAAAEVEAHALRERLRKLEAGETQAV